MQNVAQRMKHHLLRSRITLFSFLLPLAAVSLWNTADSVLRIVIVLLGFSLIIFFHELGHFIVARMCSVKCLAFSLGIGPRAFGWRKGAGLTFGRDPWDPDVLLKKKEKTVDDAKRLEHMEAATTHSDLPTSAQIPPHPRQVGDCDYRLSYLPLGGYVRMLGQDDMDPTKVSRDPHAFNMRPIWQRMCIVSAGVIMNIIFAAVAFAIIFSTTGVKFPVGEVGFVVAGMPADGKLKMGDRITAIDNERPRQGSFVEFTDIIIKNALASGDREIRYDFIRPGEEDKGEQTVYIRPVRSEDSPFLSIGVRQMQSLHIVSSRDLLHQDIELRKKTEAQGGINDPEGARELSKLTPGGTITAINGKPLQSYMELYNEVQKTNGKPVELTISYPDGSHKETTITITPKLTKYPGIAEYPTVFGLAPRTRIAGIQKPDRFLLVFPGSPLPAAKAGMKVGDEIISVGVRRWPTVEQFRDAVGKSAGKEIEVVVLRDGKEVPLKITPIDSKGVPRIGVELRPALNNLAVTSPSGGSGPLADIIGPGEQLKLATVDNEPVKDWDDVIARLKTRKAGESVQLGFLPAGAGASTEASPKVKSLVMTEDMVKSLDREMHYMLNLPVETLQKLQRASSLADGTMLGLDHTKKFVLQVYMTLLGLVRGTVGPENLHGMVGITYVGYQVQERGMAWFWYLMAMVSVNLAVANFLPLPIVDGGLFLLLILEKIRGKPLSLKVQSAIQVVGIVLLAGMFLFVTWNDLQLFK